MQDRANDQSEPLIEVDLEFVDGVIEGYSDEFVKACEALWQPANLDEAKRLMRVHKIRALVLADECSEFWAKDTGYFVVIHLLSGDVTGNNSFGNVHSRMDQLLGVDTSMRCFDAKLLPFTGDWAVDHRTYAEQPDSSFAKVLRALREID